MRHICIITYYFYPLNQVAVWRQYYRAKYLSRNGFYVTIITRYWHEREEQHPREDTLSTTITKEKLWEGVDVIRVPAGSTHLQTELSSWQRHILKYSIDGNQLLALFYRQLAFFLLPMDYHLRLMVNAEDVEAHLNGKPDTIIASGDPWHVFEIGNQLAHRWQSKLICEYRDPWNYVDKRFRVEGFNSYKSNPLSQLKRGISIKREQKLTKHADAIISVSEPWTDNAKKVTGITNAFTITNGFEPQEFERIQTQRNKIFTITYVGNLHAPPQQNIVPFIKGLDTFLRDDPARVDNTRVQFIGTADSYNYAKTEQYLKQCQYYNEVIHVTHKLDKATSIEMQKASHLLLFVAHQELIGQYPAKIFEYLAAQTPIMLAPDDGDVCHELIERTATGRICNSEKDVTNYVAELYHLWHTKGEVPYKPNQAEIEKYTYKAQNDKFIDILLNHI